MTDFFAGEGEPAFTEWEELTLDQLASRLLGYRPRPEGRPRIIAIDGRGGSGKSTLAERIAERMPRSAVVHSDDLAWAYSIFGWDGVAIEHVLDPLRAGEAIDYRPPGWVSSERQGSVTVAAELDLVILEGTGILQGSADPLLRCDGVDADGLRRSEATGDRAGRRERSERRPGARPRLLGPLAEGGGAVPHRRPPMGPGDRRRRGGVDHPARGRLGRCGAKIALVERPIPHRAIPGEFNWLLLARVSSVSTSVMSRRAVTSTALTAGAGAIFVLVLIFQRINGADGYPTDPIGTVALAGAAVLAEACRPRLATGGNARAARLAGGVTASVLLLLLLSALAVGLVSTGPLASAAVALWSVAWIPPLVLSQLVASSAVRPLGHGPRLHVVVGATSVVAVLAGALLWQPIDPFVGVASIAPESWPERLSIVGPVATVVGFGGLLLLPIGLGRAAASSRARARMRLGVAAAGTMAAPLTILFCVALAIARDPGGVDPSAGSVAFQVAIAAGTAAGVMCALLVSGELTARRVSMVTRIASVAVAALAVAAVATLVVAAGLPATPTALIVAALAVAAIVVAWRAGGTLGEALSIPQATSVPDAVEPASATPRATSTAHLTLREREVLSHLADGASNAGIAAQLVVSERTVDAHLRAIFSKLDLTPDPGANRRVLAAKRWLESRSDAK